MKGMGLWDDLRHVLTTGRSPAEDRAACDLAEQWAGWFLGNYPSLTVARAGERDRPGGRTRRPGGRTRSPGRVDTFARAGEHDRPGG